MTRSSPVAKSNIFKDILNFNGDYRRFLKTILMILQQHKCHLSTTSSISLVALKIEPFYSRNPTSRFFIRSYRLMLCVLHHLANISFISQTLGRLHWDRMWKWKAKAKAPHVRAGGWVINFKNGENIATIGKKWMRKFIYATSFNRNWINTEWREEE